MNFQMIFLLVKIKTRMSKYKIALFSFILFTHAVLAQEFPEPMSPPQLVNDYAGLLNSQEKELLEGKLRRYNDTTSTEFTIVIIRSTGPYDIGQYAAELGEKWGVGKKGKDNGLLILVAVEDREVWVSTGYGLEPTVTDANIKRVVENYIKPNFRKEQYFEGLDEATSIFMAMAQGEFDAKKDNGKGGGAGALFMLALFLFFVVGIPYLRYRSMKKHHFGGKKNIDFFTAMLLMGSLGRRRGGGNSFNDFSGGGGSFGGGGGGFGGFGGGSFGGGGAGGSW